MVGFPYAFQFSGVSGLPPEWIAAAEVEADLVESAEVAVVAATQFTLNTLSACTVGLFLQGDDPRSCAVKGASRFASVATTAVVAPTAEGAVPLPDAVTRTESEQLQTLALELRQQLAVADYVTPMQREQLEHLVESAVMGDVGLLEFVRSVGTILQENYIDTLRNAGIEVSEEKKDGMRYYKISYDASMPQHRVLEPLVMLMEKMQELYPQWRWMDFKRPMGPGGSDHFRCKLCLPVWGDMMKMLDSLQPHIQWLGSVPTNEMINSFREQNQFPVELQIRGGLTFIRTIHSVYHALSWQSLSPSVRELAVVLYSVLWFLTNERGLQGQFKRLMNMLLEMDLHNPKIEGALKAIRNALDTDLLLLDLRSSPGSQVVKDAAESIQELQEALQLYPWQKLSPAELELLLKVLH